MEGKYSSLDQRVEQLRELRSRAPAGIVTEFDERFDQSWIYHDNALEGIVITYQELKAAIDKRIVSDVTLIPMYEEIKNHKTAIEEVRKLARAWAPERADKKKRKNHITVELLHHFHEILAPEEENKGAAYRKENPLHRTYFHEISQPDKIALKMKKLSEWLEEDEAIQLHPVERAAKFHYRFMAIFPWLKTSGKVARLLMNLLLLRDGYPPVVIHSIERQRYYDVLRIESAGLVPLIVESMDNSVETAIRFFEELEAASTPTPRKKKSA